MIGPRSTQGAIPSAVLSQSEEPKSIAKKKKKPKKAVSSVDADLKSWPRS
jgi:hypothetical protein